MTKIQNKANRRTPATLQAANGKPGDTRTNENAEQSQKYKRWLNSMTWDDNKDEFERGNVGDVLHRGQPGTDRGQLPSPRNSRVPRAGVDTRPALPRARLTQLPPTLPGRTTGPAGRSGAWGGLKDRPRRWPVLPNSIIASYPSNNRMTKLQNKANDQVRPFPSKGYSRPGRLHRPRS